MGPSTHTGDLYPRKDVRGLYIRGHRHVTIFLFAASSAGGLGLGIDPRATIQHYLLKTQLCLTSGGVISC
jgi:hypothetical protein